MTKTTKPNRTRPKRNRNAQGGKGRAKSQEPPPRNVLSVPLEKRLQHEAPEAMTYGENMWC